jgi:hypothetical protein
MAVLDWVDKWLRRPTMHQCEVSEIAELKQIHDAQVNLVYLRRSVDEDVELYIRHLLLEGFPALSVPLNRHEVGQVVHRHLSGTGHFAVGKSKLEKDIVQLTQQFMDLVRADCVRLVLKVVEDDACRKFHTDAYDLRLLCTYFGKGTEWLPDAFVNRDKLVGGTNDEIVRNWKQVQALHAFDVAILKGEPASRPTGGIVHRSPPIERAGEKRFLLRLDY